MINNFFSANGTLTLSFIITMINNCDGSLTGINLANSISLIMPHALFFVSVEKYLDILYPSINVILFLNCILKNIEYFYIGVFCYINHVYFILLSQCE